jgi:hypothetical protein
MSTVAFDSATPRRLPHWGWLLFASAILLVSLIGLEVVWPAYRVHAWLSRRAARFHETDLEIERPRWIAWIERERVPFIPWIDRPVRLLVYGQVSDDDVTEMDPLFEVGSLTLNATLLTEQGMRRLGAFSRLETLRIEAYEPLKATLPKSVRSSERLKSVSLVGKGITDDVLDSFEEATGLQELSASDTSITGEHASFLARLPSLQTLDFSDSPISGKGLAEICRWQRLESLKIAYDNRVVNTISNVRNDLPSGHVSVIGAGSSFNPFPHFPESVRLRKFVVDSERFHTVAKFDEDFAGLENQAELAMVVLDETGVTDTTVSKLAALPKLAWIGLRHTGITRESLQILKAMPQLKALRVVVPYRPKGSNPLTVEQIEEFFRARPDVKESFSEDAEP